MSMKSRIVVLGAGFGGLELSTLLSESLGDSIEVTLIDKSESFLFGYSKLDVMFGRATLDALRLPYRNFVKPGVRFVRQTITAIDPHKRRITTDSDTYEADFLIVALGADYDMAATPGLAEVNEFYSVDGAARLRDVLPGFKKGKALIGVCGAPFKCPPAPSECALLLHDYLATRGVRDACEISFVLPLGSPVPPSPVMSLLLYFNLYAQSRNGLGLTALEAGASLLPLSATLLALALLASVVAARVGLRNAMTGGMALITIASIIIGAAVAEGGLVLLAIGFFVMGAGLAMPYASAPRLALSALSPTQAGQGSGIVNACTFLGGSVGVAGGAIAFALWGFVAVLTMIALAGIIGAVLSRAIPKTG
jgi:hypothetical protein